VAKHPPDQQTKAAKYPHKASNNNGGKASASDEGRQSIRQQRGAAKHPPDDLGNSNEVDEMRRGQAQKHGLPEESRRPPPGERQQFDQQQAELPRRRLKEIRPY